MSLLSVSTPPPTPGLVERDSFFSEVDQSSPSLHFAKPQDPLTLARTESSVPAWGTGRVFNQPQAKSIPYLPPPTVLKYSRIHREQARAILKNFSRTSARGSKTKGQEQGGLDWSVKPAVQGNGGLTNAINGASKAGLTEHRQWVGTIGFPTDNLEEDKRDSIDAKLEDEYDALTVYVDDKDFDGFYVHYCKTILWPVLHYQIPDHPKSKAYEDHSWIYYVRVNEAFAEKVVANYKHGDTIWVHDYHLLLVPGMIRKKLPDARIGFFLHTAFPSSEVFRCLAVRKQLLEGMLGANLIAFQAQEYAHHFLQTCSRLLVVEATEEGVQLETHFVNVTSAPIGVVPKQFETARQEPEVAEWVQIIKEKYQGKQLIVARDKLDNIRGVRQKLLSFEVFLKKNPQWRENVVLVQVATSSSVEKALENQISDIVTRINSQYSSLTHQPLVFLKQDIVFSQYLALLTAADILMLTPLRDGMNLTCHEYILCQDGAMNDKKYGPLILSEFTGSSSLFKGNDISVNPWDYQQCARAIKYCLEMSAEEKERRYLKLLNAVKGSDGVHWIKTLMGRLDSAYEAHQARDTMSVPRLSINTLSQQYKSSNFRLFILDYEGTLTTWGAPKKAVITSPERVTDALSELISASDRNIVYVTSAREPLELELMFAHIPGIGLISENGCFIRPFSSPTYPAQTKGWVDLADVDSAAAWKESVSPILAYYRERIPGSYIVERRCSLIFHYEDAEVGEAASRLAGDCSNHINDSCSMQHVHAVPFDKGVRIESTDVSKMTAARWVFNSVAAQRLGEGHIDKLARRDSSSQPPDSAVDLNSPGAGFDDPVGKEATMLEQPDFLMVAGDDRDDEGTFRWANLLAKEGLVKNAVSVCVGKRNTEASCMLTQGATGMFFLSGGAY